MTAVRTGTYANRMTATGQDGDYIFPALAVGDYTVVVEHQGFSQFQESAVKVSFGRVTVVDARLQLATVAQVVTVEATAPLIETASTQLGAVVGDCAVSQLALNARDTYQLLQLQPGVQSQVGSDLFYSGDRVGPETSPSTLRLLPRRR